MFNQLLLAAQSVPFPSSVESHRYLSSFEFYLACLPLFALHSFVYAWTASTLKRIRATFISIYLFQMQKEQLEISVWEKKK